MTVLGIDYASVDQNAHPDLRAAHAAGARFVYLRKSYTWYEAKFQTWVMSPDADYARDAQAARDAGLVVGSYLFPSFALDAPSVQAQLSNFFSAPGEIKPGIDLPPCLDVEFPNRGIVDTRRTQSAVLDLVRQYVEGLRVHYACLPMIYTSRGQWHDSNGLGGPPAPWIAECPLWQKTAYRLGAGQPVDQVTPREPHVDHDPLHDPHDYFRIPAPWANSGYWIQQYQGDARGFPGLRQVDVNRFRNVTFGDSGGHVAWLQRKLDIIGFPLFGPLNATGHFDNDTVHAVTQFQTHFGLTASGVCDLPTFAALTWT